MRVYHRTNHAEEILAGGFRDSTDTYMTANEYTGAWVSDTPMGINEGVSGDGVIELTLPQAVFEQYE